MEPSASNGLMLRSTRFADLRIQRRFHVTLIFLPLFAGMSTQLDT